MQKDEVKPATETQAWVKEIALGYKFLMSGFFSSIAIIKTKKKYVWTREMDRALCVCGMHAENINKEKFIVYVFLFTIILLIKSNAC